jgi:hypothetical protein
MAETDPRVEFVYQESLRGLLQQQAAVESLHNRAGTLIFAASFASSLLGAKALADGLNALDWTAVGLLAAIGALTVIMLWPYYNMSFRFDAADLLRDYVDAEPPATMTEMHRALALQIKENFHRNGRIVRRMREAFQLALILLVVNILVWLASIAGLLNK